MKLETLRKELKQKYTDLDIAEIEGGHLIIYGLPFDWYDYGNWKIIISKNKFEFKENTDVESDLVLLAHKFRTDWFKV